MLFFLTMVQIQAVIRLGLKKLWCWKGRGVFRATGFGIWRRLIFRPAYGLPEEALPWRNENFTIYAREFRRPPLCGGHGSKLCGGGDQPVLFTDISGHWGGKDILWCFRVPAADGHVGDGLSLPSEH